MTSATTTSAWSCMRGFAEAQREDLERFVNRESLVSMWLRLRRLLGPHARREWERKLMTTACR